MENIQAIRDLLEDDRRSTVSKISRQVGLSYRSCQAIITRSSGFCKMCALCAPRLLTVQQKLACLQVYKSHSERFAEEEDAILNRIFSCNESWVHHYRPE